MTDQDLMSPPFLDFDGETECPRCGERFGIRVDEINRLGVPGCCGGPTLVVKGPNSPCVASETRRAA